MSGEGAGQLLGVATRLQERQVLLPRLHDQVRQAEQRVSDLRLEIIRVDAQVALLRELLAEGPTAPPAPPRLTTPADLAPPPPVDGEE